MSDSLPRPVDKDPWVLPSQPWAQNFLAQIAAEWRVADLPAEARGGAIDVRLKLRRDGTIDEVYLFMSFLPETAAAAAFEVARAAIERAESRFDLPAADRDQWKTIQLTFDPAKGVLP